MPKTKKMCEAMTRLAPNELEGCRQVVQRTKQSLSGFIREAVVEKLAKEERNVVDQWEGIYAKQMRGCTERTCGLLAKVGFDACSMYIYLARLDPEAMRECRALAVKRLSKALGPIERNIALGLEQQVTSRVS